MNLLKMIAATIVAAFKAITGQKSDIALELPEVAITTGQIDQCIEIVNQVKSVVEHPVTILVTDLIPGHVDDLIREKVAAALPDLISGLTFAKNWVKDNADRDALTNAALETVIFSENHDKNAFYHSLAARLIMIVSDGKVTWSEAVSFIETYFVGLIIHN